MERKFARHSRATLPNVEIIYIFVITSGSLVVIASLIVVDGSRKLATRKRVGLGCGAPVAKGGSPSEPKFL